MAQRVNDFETVGFKFAPSRVNFKQSYISHLLARRGKRMLVADLPTGPKDARSTVLTPDEEAIIVDFRPHTLLPLDYCL